MSYGTILVGFANDVALVINAHNADLFKETANPALGTIQRWMHKHGLDLAAEKNRGGDPNKETGFPPFRVSVIGI